MNGTELQEQIDALAFTVQTIWLLVTGIGILSMQVGFAMLETGAISSKNVRATLLKSLSDTAIGGVVWVLFGYGLLSGKGTFASGTGATFLTTHDPANFARIFQQFGFAALATTMVSGSILGRCKFFVYIFYAVLGTGVFYPVQAHWVWAPNGWLRQMGFIDYAGGTVVHVFGGCAALAGAILCGPRAGRFQDAELAAGSAAAAGTITEAAAVEQQAHPPHAGALSGGSRTSDEIAPSLSRNQLCAKCLGVVFRRRKVRNLPGHSIIIYCLGGLLLFVGWFFFNVASLGPSVITHEQDARYSSAAALNTLVASGSGTVFAIAYSYVLHQRFDLAFIINCLLTSTVVITPGAGFLWFWVALIAGPLAVLVFTLFRFLILHVAGIDDPLDVFAVHAGGGLVGMVLVGLLHPQFGWCNTGQARFFGVEILGMVTCGVFGFGCSGTYFAFMHALFGILYSENEQLAGLDFLYFEVESQADIDWVDVQEYNVRERYRREQSARQRVHVASSSSSRHHRNNSAPGASASSSLKEEEPAPSSTLTSPIQMSASPSGIFTTEQQGQETSESSTLVAPQQLPVEIV